MMIVGVPKEIKDNEYRVGMVPSGTEKLVNDGHKVLVQKDAGVGSWISDEEYRATGATIVDTAAEVFAKADMIVKVKEPQPSELDMLRKEQILFTYLHLAADRELTERMLKTKAVGIAYETVTSPDGSLPLLTPMSEVAGRISIQEGAKYLEKTFGGRGVLLSGVPGVKPASVVILGAGVVGTNAAKVAAGLGASVTVLDINLDRLRYLDDIMPPNVMMVKSDRLNILKALKDADMVVGAVLVRGARAPRLITRDMLKQMKTGAVIVDVAVDQGGCCETVRPTTHSDPVYVEEGVVHYCVTNMPGVVSRTSTFALTNATIEYAVEIANKGYRNAVLQNPALYAGLSVWCGHLTCSAVAESFGMKFEEARSLLCVDSRQYQ